MINQEIQSLRSEQLDQLREGILPQDGEERSASVVFLQGPEGIGKTSLTNDLKTTLESLEMPLLWIDPSGLKAEEDILKYPQLLSHTIQTNHPIMKSRVEEAARDLGREAFRLEAMASQVNAGTEENADPPPDLAETWSRIFTEKLLVEGQDEEGNPLPPPLTVFLLEDFETFNKSQQLWVKKHLIDAMHDADARSTPSFLVTTTPEDAKNIANFFPKDNYSQTEIVLEPFSEEQLGDLLLKISLPEISPAVFLEKTDGFPARINDVASTILNEELTEETAQGVDQFLSGKNAEQIEWISVAVHLPEYNEEGFRLYFDETVAKEAFEWLGKQVELVKQTPDGPIYVEELKTNLLQCIRKKDPAQFQTRNQMAGQYIKLLRRFNGTRSREYLNHLACLNYFSEEDLNYLFGALATEYTHFVRKNPGYFEKGSQNHRIRPEYQDLVQEYRALLPSSTTESLTQKAKEYWSEKSIKLQGERQSLQQKKVVEESKLNELNSQVDELDIFLNKDDEQVSDEERMQAEHEEHQRLLEEEKHSVVNKRVKRSKIIHALVNSILILLGIAFFYFGIFSRQDTQESKVEFQSSSLIPCLFGIGLIATGVLRPLRDKIIIQKSKIESRLDKQVVKEKKKLMKKKDKAAAKGKEGAEISPAGEGDELESELSGAESLLLFKKLKIESRADDLQEKVDGLTIALESIEQVLEEPLVT